MVSMNFDNIGDDLLNETLKEELVKYPFIGPVKFLIVEKLVKENRSKEQLIGVLTKAKYVSMDSHNNQTTLNIYDENELIIQLPLDGVFVHDNFIIIKET